MYPHQHRLAKTQINHSLFDKAFFTFFVCLQCTELIKQ